MSFRMSFSLENNIYSTKSNLHDVGIGYLLNKGPTLIHCLQMTLHINITHIIGSLLMSTASIHPHIHMHMKQKFCDIIRPNHIKLITINCPSFFFLLWVLWSGYLTDIHLISPTDAWISITFVLLPLAHLVNIIFNYDFTMSFWRLRELFCNDLATLIQKLMEKFADCFIHNCLNHLSTPTALLNENIILNLCVAASALAALDFGFMPEHRVFKWSEVFSTNKTAIKMSHKFEIYKK